MIRRITLCQAGVPVVLFVHSLLTLHFIGFPYVGSLSLLSRSWTSVAFASSWGFGHWCLVRPDEQCAVERMALEVCRTSLQKPRFWYEKQRDFFSVSLRRTLAALIWVGSLELRTISFVQHRVLIYSSLLVCLQTALYLHPAIL